LGKGISPRTALQHGIALVRMPIKDEVKAYHSDKDRLVAKEV
jgi:hypothetical protein